MKINMKTVEEKNNLINELIQYNNDRIDGYEKVSEETGVVDTDLRALFVKMANDSRSYRKDLGDLVTRMGGKVEAEGSVSASIHRAWIDFKTAITGNDRSSILSSCEFGENAILTAYDAVLADTESFIAEELAVVSEQRNGLGNSSEAITNYKKLNEAVK
jgi:uncharacterized protein (TIGR02284 family)